MRALRLQKIDAATLPRPSSDTHLEHGPSSGYSEARAGYHVLRRHGIETSCLLYCVSGEGFVRDRQDRSLRVSAGTLVLIHSHQYQEFGVWRMSPQWNFHWAYFASQPRWGRWLPLGTATGLDGVTLADIAGPALQDEVNQLFVELHRQRTRVEPWRDALFSNLLERILILSRNDSDSVRPLDPRVVRVLEAIEHSAPDELRSAELGAIAGLSLSRLVHLFKQQTGSSILSAINRVRLRVAQQALQDPSASLLDVAELSGFQSPYSFSNWYLKQSGIRPGEYRRRCKAGPP
jgi:AraC family transcriptional regulator of arabinose operon